MNGTNKRDQWFAWIEDWEASELTQSDYCRQQGISLASFNKWRTKYIASNHSYSKDFQQQSKSIASGNGFLPLNLTTSGDGSRQMIEIDLPYGIQLRLPIDAGTRQ